MKCWNKTSNEKLPIWLMVIINVVIFWIGQAMACYFYWVGHGDLHHDSSLWVNAMLAAVVSFGLNTIPWLIRSDVT